MSDDGTASFSFTPTQVEVPAAQTRFLLARIDLPGAAEDEALDEDLERILAAGSTLHELRLPDGGPFLAALTRHPNLARIRLGCTSNRTPEQFIGALRLLEPILLGLEGQLDPDL